MNPLDRLLKPRSIAIVGVSEDLAKHGNRVLRNLLNLGFDGEIWGVNPKLPDLETVKVFASLSELPSRPDIVISALPAHLVPTVAREASVVGATALIVFAGGFSESGETGLGLEVELQSVARETGIRILGPNSGGVIAPSFGVAMSFLTCLDRSSEEIRGGTVGLVTQSGGMGSYVHNLAAARGTGLAASISTGNEADLGVADGITLLVDLPETKAIAVILETVRDGPGFIKAVRYANEAQKRVVVVRIGKSDRGQQLMRTHTGALAHPNRVFDGVLNSLGVSIAETPEEMLEIAELLALTPDPKGPRVGIVTHSGGVAIMLSDLAMGTPIDLPSPGVVLRETLSEFLQLGSADNPLDMGAIIGGPHRFAQAVQAFTESGEVDLVLAVSSAHPPAHSQGRVDALLDLDSAVPVVHLWMAGDQANQGLESLRMSRAAVTEEPRAAIKALAALVRSSIKPAEIQVNKDSTVVDQLNEHQSKQLLAAWGLDVVKGDHVTTIDEAIEVAESLGYPVVVKLSSVSLRHKSDIGGVILGVGDTTALRGAFDQVISAGQRTAQEVDGVLIEKHVTGTEVIIGALRDSTFGPMVLVGIGGIVAEALDDVQMALAPLSHAEAMSLINSLAGQKVMTHPRSGVPADTERLATLLVTFGDRFAGDPRISAVDLNPVVWTGTDWLILDAVIET